MIISKWLLPALGVALVLLLAGCEEPVPVGPLSPSNLPAEARLTSISFVDPSHGWVVAADCGGESTTSSGGCRALVYATTDGGHTWSPDGRLLLVPRRMQFTDQETGWLVGGIGQRCGNSTCPNVVMQTTDSGRTWQRTSTTSVDLIDLSFASPRDGWILGQTCTTSTSCTATLVSTDSTGQTWSNQQLPLSGHGFRLDRLSPSVGWVGGITDGQAVLIASTDDGRRWERLDTPCRGESLAFDFSSASQGWLACSGSAASTFYRTSDGGRSWQLMAAPLAAAFTGGPGSRAVTSLGLASPTDGWIVDDGGVILRTGDGGQTWTPSLTASQPVADGFFLDPAHGWFAAGQTVWATADGGATWDKVAVSGDSRSGSVTMSVK